MNKEKIAFQSTEEEFTPTKGVKLDRKRSFLNEKPTKEEFETQADEIAKKRQRIFTQTFELSQEFKNLMNDLTVPSQIGTLQRSKEKEVIIDLINFADMLNSDQSEREGKGSTTVIALILKMLLNLRDERNELSYKLHQLEQYASRLEAKFNSSSQADASQSK